MDYDGKLDVEEFIDESIVKLATANKTKAARAAFSQTFNLLNEALGADALRRLQDGEHTGRVGLAAFESIAVGVAKNIDKIMSKKRPVSYVKKRITEFWESPEVSSFFVAGLRGTIRIQRTIPFGADWFAT